MTALVPRGAPADTAPMTRATAVLGGLAALVITVAAFGFAIYAMGDELRSDV